jgi:penicillin-binding protein activator
MKQELTMINGTLTLWTRRTALTLLAAAGMIAAGCGPTVTKVDPNDPNSGALTTGAIDPQDWNNAGASMVQSLLNSGCLDNAPHKPAILVISRIKNETSYVVDTDLLTKNIRIALLQTGKIQVSTTAGLGGNAEDPYAQQKAQEQQFLSNGQAPQQQQDYTLSGKIIEQYTRVDDQRQHTYTFQLSLTDLRSGTAVWEDQRQVGKVINSPGVGF